MVSSGSRWMRIEPYHNEEHVCRSCPETEPPTFHRVGWFCLQSDEPGELHSFLCDAHLVKLPVEEDGGRIVTIKED